MELKSISKNSQNEIVLKKSKFIAFSFYVQNVEEVNNILEDLKQKYADATHVCYAYRVYPMVEKCFDDGEPSGTAGKPMLDCIKKQNLNNTLVVVVRYFGGVKLGAGGLVRAYSQSATEVLALSGQNLAEECQKLEFYIDISQSKFLPQIKNLEHIKRFENVFEDKIKIEIFVTSNQTQNVKNQINNLLKTDVEFLTFEEKYFI